MPSNPCNGNEAKMAGHKRSSSFGEVAKWKKLKRRGGLGDSAASSSRNEEDSDSIASNVSEKNGQRMAENFQAWCASQKPENPGHTEQATLEKILLFFKDRKECWKDISWPWMSSGVYYLCKELEATNDFEGILVSARARGDFNTYMQLVYTWGGAAELPKDGVFTFCPADSNPSTRAGDLAEYLIWVLKRIPDF